MPRPRRFRRILEEPQIRCFKPEKENLGSVEPIKLSIDKLEERRLRD